MRIRLECALPCNAETAYEMFCDVDTLPRWVPELARATVASRHPDGQPAQVQFTARPDAGGEIRYTLSYAYDAARRRVAWRPLEPVADAVQGYAAFEETRRGCRLIYAMDYGDRWAGDRDEARDRAQAAIDSFATFIARRASP